ncbi:MAG: hypothetical protein LBK82_14900 [Planctomycetaceae bacterium]|nr:hypothetical protein [Planctomycetaceae bacterium]
MPAFNRGIVGYRRRNLSAKGCPPKVNACPPKVKGLNSCPPKQGTLS